MSTNKLFSYNRKDKIYEDAYKAIANNSYSKFLVEEKVSKLEEIINKVRGLKKEFNDLKHDFLKEVEKKDDEKDINKSSSVIVNDLTTLASDMEKIVNKIKRRENKVAESNLNKDVEESKNEDEKDLKESKINLINTISDKLVTIIEETVNSADDEQIDLYQDDLESGAEENVENFKKDIENIKNSVASGDEISEGDIDSLKNKFNTLVDYLISDDNKKDEVLAVLKEFNCLLDKFNEEGLDSNEVWEIRPDIAPSSDENNYY